MIAIEKLRAVTHIVTHDGCPDGIASAMLLKQVLPEAQITFLQYNTVKHKTLTPEKGMLFCDITPHEDNVSAFLEVGAIVLDHHNTQEKIVAQFGEDGVFADAKTQPGVSGARLAYEVLLNLWDRLPDPNSSANPVWSLAYLAGIRDTWQKKHPLWLQSCEQAAALKFWPIEELLVLSPIQWAEKLALGPMLYARQLRSAKQCAQQGFRFESYKGRRVVVFEGLSKISDTADLISDEADLVVAFGFNTDGGKPKVVYSTRSHTGFDCSAFALAYGGGGHKPSAGFQRFLEPGDPQPYEMLRRLLMEYEAIEGKQAPVDVDVL